MQKLLLSFLALLLIALSVFVMRPSSAYAAADYNHLIDDSVFDNTGKMSASSINSWLNSNFPNSCISTNHGFSAPDPTGYSPSAGFTYGGPVSAGQVIYDAAAAYGLNPQVLLATLQKEESLVDGGAGCSALRFSASVGYGCPDGGTTYNYSHLNPAMYYINGSPVNSINGTCVKSAADVGFAQQLIHASWLLKFGEQRSEGNTGWDVQNDNFPESGDHWDNSDDPQACYGGPMTQGYRKRCSSDSSAVYFDGYTTIDGSSVHMDTGATAALYWYTPHQHGNQVFFDTFSGWFGNPTIDHSHDMTLVGDWNGDGADTVAIRRGNAFFFDNNNDGAADNTIVWGKPTDTLLVGDWNGDEYTDIGLRRGSTYFLYDVKNSRNLATLVFGKSTDTAIVGKWNGANDGIGLKRGSTYFLDFNNDGSANSTFGYGQPSDVPLVGDWNNSGVDHIGLRRGDTYLLNYGDDGHANDIFSWGHVSDGVYVGHWTGGESALALRRGTTYYIDDNNDGHADHWFSWGRLTNQVIVGDWDGGLPHKDRLGLKQDSDEFLGLGWNGVPDISFTYTY